MFVSITAAVVEEEPLKVAIIYKLASFVSWPDTAFATTADAFQLCALTRSDEVGLLQQLQGREIAGHKIKISLLAEKQLPEQKSCHLLYMPQGMAAAHRPLRQHMLTIGENSGFAADGGMVEIYKQQNRFRFRINIEAAHNAGLSIAAPLLQLSDVIGEVRP